MCKFFQIVLIAKINEKNIGVFYSLNQLTFKDILYGFANFFNFVAYIYAGKKDLKIYL